MNNAEVDNILTSMQIDLLDKLERVLDKLQLKVRYTTTEMNESSCQILQLFRVSALGIEVPVLTCWGTDNSEHSAKSKAIQKVLLILKAQISAI